MDKINSNSNFQAASKEQKAPYSLLTNKEYEFHVNNQESVIEHSHHNYVEIEIIDKGCTINKFNSKDPFIMTEGDISLILPGTTHKHSSYQSYKATMLNISLFTTSFQEIAQAVYGFELSNFESNILRLTPDQLQIARSYSKSLLSTTDESAYNSTLKSFAVFCIGIFTLTNKKQKEMPEWLKEFIEKIDSVPLDKLKIKDLYSLSNYSQSVISINFNKYIGKSLVKYVDDKKMEYAKNLLSKTNIPISEISYKIGFNSVSHLNHLFKLKFGMSPNEYRKKSSNGEL